MTVEDDRLAQITARYERAHDEVIRLCEKPYENWRWSIPANPERDTDLILTASLKDIPWLLERVRELEAEKADALRRVTAHQRLGLAAIFMAEAIGSDEVEAEQARYDRELKAETARAVIGTFGARAFDGLSMVEIGHHARTVWGVLGEDEEPFDLQAALRSVTPSEEPTT